MNALHAHPGVFAAVRFDGRTALAQPVVLHVEPRMLRVSTPDGELIARVPLDPARFSERFLEAPRMVGLDDGAVLEVPDADGRFDRALMRAGVAPTPVQRMQRVWPAALAALAGLVGVLFFAYTHGLPAAAHWIALRLPADLEQRLGDEVLAQLDRKVLAPSQLPPARQAYIRQRISAAAAIAAPDVPYRIEFRFAEGRRSVNAMTLPGGIIVLLDGLVVLADSDEALLGVVGHEFGHAAGKHSLRQLLQALGVGAMAGLVWGDFSHAVANVPLALGVLRYSRDFERDADLYAVRFLQENGLSVEPLIGFFDKMSEEQRKWRSAPSPAFLSSHPGTAERQQRLRAASAP